MFLQVKMLPFPNLGKLLHIHTSTYSILYICIQNLTAILFCKWSILHLYLPTYCMYMHVNVISQSHFNFVATFNLSLNVQSIPYYPKMALTSI